MKVDALAYLPTVEAGGLGAAAAEGFGYDGWWAAETQADVFLSCAVAAERTGRVEIGTGIAVALARNPMTVAQQANDLHLLSGGRFMLGLGSQIRPHIEKRFSMPWSKPAARMREFVLAVRAIWDCWATGGRLDFRGDFYSHTLMTPFFDPGPNPHGNPKIVLAGVGPLMSEAAGEVADGLFCHGFGNERYLREVTLPAVERGRAKAGKALEGFDIIAPGFVVAAETEEQRTAGREFVRNQIGFYGSTPAYRPVLEVHGWGELQEELNALTKRGAWGELAAAVSDEVLESFAVVGPPDEAAAEVRRRYGDVATRLTLPVPDGADHGRWAQVVEAFRS